MKIKKIFTKRINVAIAILATIGFVFMPSLKAFAIGDINQDVIVTAIRGEVPSGSSAMYNLEWTLTGSRKTYSNVNLVLDLPNSQYAKISTSLSDLAINGVIPTHNQSANQLSYSFPEIETGQTYRLPIIFSTENGVTPDETKLTLKATVTGENIPSNSTSSATVTVQNSAPITTSKKANIGSEPPAPGDEISWTMTALTNKRNSGSLFYQEGTNITLVDKLPNGIIYVSDNAGGVYNASNHTVTWTFPAPSYDEQKSIPSGSPTFRKDITLITKIDESVADNYPHPDELIKYHAVFTNEFSATGTVVGNKQVSSSSEATIVVTDGGYSHPTGDGSVHPPVHYGPKDSMNGANSNSIPSVYDSADLSWALYFAGGGRAHTADYKSLVIEYNFDTNAPVQTMRFITTGYTIYRNSDDPVNGTPVAFEPDISIDLVVNGTRRNVVPLIPKDQGQFVTYTREQLGLQPNDVVSKMYMDFGAAPMGMSHGDWIFYTTQTVKPGFTGQLEQTARVVGEDVDGTFENQTDILSDYMGPRRVNVLPYPPISPPVVSSHIKYYYLNDDGSLQFQGTNTTEIQLVNESAFTLNDPFAMIVLPPNVTYNVNGNHYFKNNTTNTYEKNKGSVTLVDGNYNGKNQQLLRIEWDATRIASGQSVGAQISLNIPITSPARHDLEVYGMFSNSEFVSPNYNSDSITNTVVQPNTNNIDRSGDNTKLQAKSMNTYSRTVNQDVTTEMFVKGELDNDYSRMGNTTLGGDIAYKMNVKIDPHFDARTMVIYNVLPSVGDLGITDNVVRDSKFTPTLNGPIILPAGMEDLFEVYYSTSTNPNRDDLTKNVDYVDPSTIKMNNPSGSESPNWQSAASVSDWSSIHSYKIVLVKGKIIPAGTSFDFNYNMTAPTTVAPALLNINTPNEERAAWNSFAVAKDEMQVVEPPRVGVVINGELPVEKLPEIKKTVNLKADTHELANRNELFKWQVEVIMGTSAGTWTHASIVDEVHEFLDIESYKLSTNIDGSDDVSNLGKFDEIKDNKVVFTFNDNGSGSYEHLSNKTYYLIIEAKIKDGITEQQLDPFRTTGNGIPNQGRLNFGNDGQFIDSNIPKVTPPPAPGVPVLPKIEKTVNKNPLEQALATRGELFKWEVKVEMGPSAGTWSHASIFDEVHEFLDIESYKLSTNIDGSDDVSNLGKFDEIKDNKVVFTFNDNGSGSYEHLSNKTYYLIIEAKIKDGITEQQLDPFRTTGNGIPNQGRLNFGNDGQLIDSNIPKVTPPPAPGAPVLPKIEKTVNKNPLEQALATRGELFKWEVKVEMGPSAGTWTHASIFDEVHEFLDIESYKLSTNIDGSDDVSNLGKFDEIKDNKVVFTFNDNGSGSYEHLSNKTYYLIIEAKIKDGITEQQLDPFRTTGNGIPNQGRLNFGNDGQFIDSNIPKVTPPPAPGAPVLPKIEKTVNKNPLEQALATRGELFKWEVKVEMGPSAGTWTHASIFDEVHEFLDIESYKLSTNIDGSDDVSNLGKFDEIKDNKVVFTFNDNGSGSYEHLSNKTYYLIIEAKINDGITEQQLDPFRTSGNGIPNQGRLNFGNDGQFIDSNIPKVTPPPAPGAPVLPKIEKTVNKNPLEQALATRGELFKWEVKVEMGPSAGTWTHASIFDEVHEFLDIESYKLSTNIDGSDDVSNLGKFDEIKDNKVVFTFNDNGSGSYEHLSNKTYYLIIEAKINDGITEQQLDPFRTSGNGIPNQGRLNFGNDGQFIDSNIPKVTPPPAPGAPDLPVIDKTVNQEPIKYELINRNEVFTWEVKVAMGSNAGNWTQASFFDNVNPLLRINSYKIVDLNGNDVSDLGNFTRTSGNNIIFDFNDDGSGSFAQLTDKTYILVIEANIREGVTDEELAPYVVTGIPNQGRFDFGNEGDSIYSNEPVVIPPELPVIDKTVNNDPLSYDLVNRNEVFTWEVKVAMGSNAGNWTQASIVDDVHPLLEVISHKLIDSNGTDVSSLGNFDRTSGNNVIFDFNDDGSDSFSHLTDKTYILVIEAKIRENVTDEELAPFIVNGIPNQGILNFGNEGDFIKSNKPTVIPPTDPELPVIDKTVNNDPLSYELVNRNEVFTWEVKVAMGSNAGNWSQASIVDNVNPLLEVISHKLVDINGSDVSDLGKFNRTSGNNVIFDFNDDGSGSFAHLTDKTYILVIESKIKEAVTDEELAPFIVSGIPNQGILNFGNDGDFYKSNIPTVKPPGEPELPVIDKTVNQDPNKYELTNRNEVFTWEVKVTMGSNAGNWSQASIVDNVNPLLKVNSYKLVDLNGTDVSDLGNFDRTSGNNIIFDFNDDGSGSFTHLSGKTYVLVIEAKIMDTVSDTELAPYIVTGIPNQGRLDFGNEGDSIYSNEPVVIPPELPVIEKTVNQDPNKYELTNRNEVFIWEVKVTMGSNAGNWSQASIVDDVNPLLEVISHKLIDSNGTDVSDLGNFDRTSGNNVIFDFNDDGSGSFTHLTDKIYILVIEAKIMDSVTDAELAPFIVTGIPNQGTLNFGNEGDFIKSNIPTVIPPTDPELPVIDKSVNQDPLSYDLINRNEVFTWEVKVSMGLNAGNWSQASIVDNINPLLEVISHKLVDLNGSDVSDLGNFNRTSGNNVIFDFNDDGSGSFAHLTDKTYILVIESKIKEDVTDEELAPFIVSGIPNEGILNFGNDGDFYKSNIPTVKPPVYPELPVIDKTVNQDPNKYELTNRNEVFTWEVKVTMGANAGNWSQASIVDNVNPLLKVNSYKLVDLNGTDVSDLGNFDRTSGNNIIFDFNDDGSGSFTHLSGKTYVLVIEANIMDTVTDAELAPYIVTGIPNQGRLDFGNEGDSIYSNEPVVIPPELPVVEKTVNQDPNKYELTNRNEVFTWEVKVTMGSNAGNWSQASIVDDVNPLLEVISHKLIDINGTEVSDLGNFDRTLGNNVIFDFNDDGSGSFTHLTDKTYILVIEARIKEEVTDEELAPFIVTGIPNQGTLNFGNEGDFIKSNIPTVIPPTDPEIPIIEKTVNQDPLMYKLINRNEVFTWEVKVAMGSNTGNWSQASIVDNVNPLLEVISHKLVDINGTNVSDLGNFDRTSGNNIIFDFNDDSNGSFVHLTDKTYILVIEAKIREDVTDEELVSYVVDGIPNQGRLDFGNEGDLITSNIPVVIPPVPELPVIEKTVNGQDSLQLENRDELFTWELKTSFGNTTATWQQASLYDKVHEFLSVEAYRLVDLNNNDMSDLGEFIIDGNTIIFEFKEQNGSFDYLANQTYILEIDAKINPDVSDAQLAPYIIIGGIPNQGRLDFGNEGDFINSNKPVVIPPGTLDPELPVISKAVNGVQSLNLVNRNDLFTWELKTSFGNKTADWTRAIITDEVHEFLSVEAYRLVDLDGKDMSSLGEFKNNGNNIVFEFTKQNDSYDFLAGKTYILEIDAKIMDKITDAQLAPYILAGGIPNQGRLDFGNEGDLIVSNIPVVTPPKPEIPTVEKSVNDKESLQLENRDELFTWELKSDFGNNTSSWKQAAIYDKVHEFLDVVEYRLVDSNGADMSHLGEFIIDGNTIIFEFTAVDESFAHLANQIYILEIDAKINKDVTDEQLAPYITKGIPNQGRLDFGNEGDSIYSNKPVVIPPKPELPVIGKSVNDKDSLQLLNRNEIFTWELKVSFGNNTANWEQAAMYDKVHELLDVVEYRLVDSNGADMSNLGKFIIDGNTIIFEFAKVDDSYAHLARQTYILEIDSKINKDVTDEQLEPYITKGIPNQGRLDFGNEGDSINSNIPVVIPPNPEIPVLEKSVNGKDSLLLENRDDLFTWQLKARLGSNTANWSQASLHDNVNELLEVVAYRIVDLNGTDMSNLGEFKVDNNNVTFTFNAKDGSYGHLANQVYVLEIDAKIKKDVKDEDLSPYVTTGIPNKGRLDFGNDGDFIHSNIPVVYPPNNCDPKLPVITKTVNGVDSLNLESRNDVFTWELKASFGQKTSDWTKASLYDEVHKYLDVVDYRLVDQSGKDVSNLGKFKIDGNKVRFNFATKDDSFAYLANKTYILEIDAKIKDSVTEDQLTQYILAGGIPNQGRLYFGKDGKFICSNIPVVVPPVVDTTIPVEPKGPKIDKNINGKQELKLENRNDVFTWSVITDFGNLTSDWTTARIVDEVHEYLEILKYRLVDQNGIDMSHLGEFKIEGNTVTFDFKPQDESYKYLNMKTLTLEIDTKIKSSTTDAQLLDYILLGGIPNQGRLDFGNDGDSILSRIPVVIPPNTVDPSVPVPPGPGPSLPNTGLISNVLLLGGVLFIATAIIIVSRKKRRVI